MISTASSTETNYTDTADALRLKPRDRMGFFYVALTCGLTVVGLWLAIYPNKFVWLFSQMLLALAFLQWFILLHEAGHQILFKTRILNTIAGNFAGFFALIPYQSWYRIHAGHHRWTGWQDKDATTESLVPRPLKKWERHIINAAWKYHLPLFSILYRLNNYWYLPRIKRFLPSNTHKRIALNVLALLAAYAVLIAMVGFSSLLASCGLGIFLSLMMQDIIILSQHTHIPQHNSGGKDVIPFAAREQVQFTRSLVFPKWFSVLILHFDAHELHHLYPYVPGYDLNKLPAPTNASVNWWAWLLAVKRLPADIFMFQNRNQTGLNV